MRLQGYENVGHVLDVLAEFHRQLAAVFSELGERAGDDRSKLMLDYLAGHQSRRANALEMYRRDAPPSLIGNWFQIPFPEDPRAFLRNFQETGKTSPDRLDDLIAQLDTFMSRLLHHMRDRAETNNVKALFEDLLEIEQRERLLRSRAMSSFSQI
jgi:hypothetical protein